MDSGVVIVIVLLAVGFAIRQFIANHRQRQRQRQRAAFFDREGMPDDLLLARLVLSEERLICDHPIPLSGRPDQVYRTDDNQLIIVDSKTRKRTKVYDKDRAQLSGYKVVIEHCGHRTVRGLVVRDYGCGAHTAFS